MLDVMAEPIASTLNKPDVALEMTLRPSLFSDFTGQPRVKEQLGIALSTVRAHLHTVYEKLHVQSRTEAVVKFLSRD